MIDLEWVRSLVEMVEESEIDSLELSRFGTRVKIRKSPPAAPSAAPEARPGAARGPGVPESAGPEGEEAADEGPPGEDEDLVAVNSPMVGTFYRAPAPDAPPYVEVGDRVQEGQTLCILEAMKLMNELESEVGGVVQEICVQNAEPVEYGQLLFRIAPDGASGS